MISKDENLHRFAVKGELLERERERERNRQRERERERQREREIERERKRCYKIANLASRK